MAAKEPAEIRKECPTCGHGWLDKYRRPECPKCLKPLTGLKPFRVPGEACSNKFWSPSDAFEVEEGDCPKGGAHTFRFGQCGKCRVGEGYARHAVETTLSGGKAKPNKSTKRTCPTCTYCWLDKYGKNECPKCNLPLGIPDAADPKHSLKAADACESESGSCPEGGKHQWKFGLCLKCRKGQGHEGNNVQVSWKKRTCHVCNYKWQDRYRKPECPKCLAKLNTDLKDCSHRSTYKVFEGGDCKKGGSHEFKFGLCRKCKITEGDAQFYATSG